MRYQIQEVLREEIFSGRFKPGQRLIEQDLCLELDISRTSLREALRSLEAEGLVTIVPHKGAVVTSLDIADIKQIYQVRGALEALAVQNFVLYGSDKDLANLKSSVEDFCKCVDNKLDGENSRDLKNQFYDCLLSINENKIIQDQLSKLNNRVSLFRSLSMARPGRLKYTAEELKSIIRAISNRDEILAGEAAKRHIEMSEKNIIELLSESKQKGIKSSHD
ncbi:GntR family transcriptional regulator [Marinobacterium nitratireducens]|uniref:GntR family transcriptional regulator n=1 Tax=Marinobacterium nitratireducens TaxID=518897 RepID=A0A917Z773_9GAMM|nr:GntR family transcriptional regulator [Marinobacterium nitratireducens]